MPVLSTIARLFDPLGLLSPVVARARDLHASRSLKNRLVYDRSCLHRERPKGVASFPRGLQQCRTRRPRLKRSTPSSYSTTLCGGMDLSFNKRKDFPGKEYPSSVTLMIDLTVI
ncbi:hypothetical protein TNCV_4976411 [Trichonephila clavipes]|nr:hypothetical protein TNCV_4976411 [Trichonephila clavipes]